MRPNSWITIILGAGLAVLGIFIIVTYSGVVGAIPLAAGVSLIYLGWSGSRTALLVFGHTCIVIGSALIAWGIYLLPYSQPTLSHVFARPLFWGLFSLFGGICSNLHGYCNCIRREK
jgi:hypothetical protein